MHFDLGTEKTLVGVKQSVRAIKGGRVRKAFIAKDAKRELVAPVLELCESCGVETVMVETMEELGGDCGIEVGAAVAVLLKRQGI